LKDLQSIIKGCINKDPKEQEMLYHRYYGFALKTVFRYIYRYEKAVDVVNDGYVKLFNAFNKFQCIDVENIEKVLMGWIKRIMVNTAIDELRRNNMMPEIGGIPEYVWEEADQSAPADQKILYKELITLVKKLPPSYRTVFNLYVIDGYSHQEIAETLNISVGTSKSNLHKAKMHLKKIIEDNNIQEAGICSL
jgi:RNA polymerase sigma factor (sigma-70 family)